MSLWLPHPLFLPFIIVGITILLWATSPLPEYCYFLLLWWRWDQGKFLRGRGCCDVSRWR
ncbi:hypothetical protein A4J61_15700 [Salmonella enterica subsp. enterica serovar Joal]|nr:hypothetical protein [Salmonella enterica subsp. enterica serovar Joal]